MTLGLRPFKFRPPSVATESCFPIRVLPLFLLRTSLGLGGVELRLFSKFVRRGSRDYWWYEYRITRPLVVVGFKHSTKQMV